METELKNLMIMMKKLKKKSLLRENLSSLNNDGYNPKFPMKEKKKLSQQYYNNQAKKQIL